MTTPVSGMNCTAYGSGFTATCARAMCLPTSSVIVVVPGARAMTVPSALTLAMVESSLLHCSHEPTRTLPLLFVTVAARCSVSPIEVAVRLVGDSPTQAAASGPIASCEGPASPTMP
jgi:hypothetical protein